MSTVKFFDVSGAIGFGPSLAVRVGRDERSYANAEISLIASVSGETNGVANIEIVVADHSIDNGVPSVLDNLIEALTNAKAEAQRRREEKT